MADAEPSVLFLGDLDDPWVAAIAEALPRRSAREHCRDALPADPPAAGVVVAHRGVLTPPDGEALRRLRERGTRVLLCVGPHVRARDVEQFAGTVDIVLPEATASETIARHLLVAGDESEDFATRPIRPMVAVVAGAFETRRMLAEACERAGYPARPFASWEEATPSRLAVWDAPVLDAGWDETLRAAAGRRSVVAMIGFADRGLVARAREAGAAACLDLPCDLDDLAFVLDRLALRPEPLPPIDGPHAVPPRPKGLRLVRPPVAEPRRGA